MNRDPFTRSVTPARASTRASVASTSRVGQCARALAEGLHRVQAERPEREQPLDPGALRERADLGVQGGRGLAQLAHVAHHEDAPAGRPASTRRAAFIESGLAL